MNIAVIYSSKTGNTRKVAEAIHASLPDGTALHDVANAPESTNYDLVFMGFWVDKGTANLEAQEYMKQLNGQRIALFATLGAYPDSDHAKQCLTSVADFVSTCTVADSFICQGAIDPKLIEWMKTLPADDPHGPNDDRRKLWADAESHPDETDLANAINWASGVLDLAKEPQA